MKKSKYWQALSAAAVCALAIALPNNAHAKRLTILYVPLDDRPVCTSYVKQTVEVTGCRLILPPEKFIAGNAKNGDPEGLWDWLQTKAPKADAAVISTDSLIYGGLVASRTHNIPQSVLQQRVKNLSYLKATLPIKLYAFGTIMRTPRSSYGNVEPLYYSKIGPSIFAYSQLLDKKGQNKLSMTERLTMQALERNLRKDELGDWLDRRQSNLSVNQELIRLSRNGKFHYLALGKDDNAPLSATHMEARQLSFSTIDMSADSFQIIDGVDQLGLLLIARAYNEAHGVQPSIHPLYSAGTGPSTLPQYSDSRLQDSVPQQVKAAGAILSPSAANADLILALNTPQNGIVKDSTADDNQHFASIANKNFASQITAKLNAGHAVSLADISYSNGADNGFMEFLSSSGSLSRLAAYNGWNTADNAVGYAIAQGILSKDMEEKDRNRLLRQRLIDDWFYQSNVRRHLADELARHSREDMKYDLAGSEKEITRFINQECHALADKYEATKGSKFEVAFPWNRLFEVYVEVKK